MLCGKEKIDQKNITSIILYKYLKVEPPYKGKTDSSSYIQNFYYIAYNKYEMLSYHISKV